MQKADKAATTELLPDPDLHSLKQGDDNQAENSQAHTLSIQSAVPEAELMSSLADAAADADEQLPKTADLHCRHATKPGESSEAESLTVNNLGELAEDEAAAKKEEAVGSPPVTIRLSFSIEPQTITSAADDAIPEEAADIKAYTSDDLLLLKDSESASKKLAESPDVLVLEQDQEQSITTVLKKHNEDAGVPAKVQPHSMLFSANTEENKLVLEDAALSAESLRRQKTEPQGAENPAQPVSLTPVSDMTEVEHGFEAAEQSSRSGSDAEHLQLYITKYAVPVPDSSIESERQPAGDFASEVELDVEGIPAIISAQAGDVGHTDILGDVDIIEGSPSVLEEDLKEVYPADDNADLSAQQQEQVFEASDMLEILASARESDAAGDSEDADEQVHFLLNVEDTHPTVQTTAATASKSCSPELGTDETVKDAEMRRQIVDNTEAASTDEEDRTIFQESKVNQEGEFGTEAQEEDAQEMTASQKRVTFQLPGKI